MISEQIDIKGKDRIYLEAGHEDSRGEEAFMGLRTGEGDLVTHIWRLILQQFLNGENAFKATTYNRDGRGRRINLIEYIVHCADAFVH